MVHLHHYSTRTVTTYSTATEGASVSGTIIGIEEPADLNPTAVSTSPVLSKLKSAYSNHSSRTRLEKHCLLLWMNSHSLEVLVRLVLTRDALCRTVGASELCNIPSYVSSEYGDDVSCHQE